MAKAPLRTVEELQAEIDKRALRVLNEYLEPSHIESRIKEAVEQRIDDIICSALGFEKDSWSSAWKLKEHDDRGAIQRALQKVVKERAEAIVSKILDDHKDTLLAGEEKFIKKAQTMAKQMYDGYCEHDLWKIMQQRLEERASVKVLEVLEADPPDTTIRLDVDKMEARERR